MKRLFATASISLAAALATTVVPAVAQAKQPTPRHRGVYLYVYRHAEKKFGKGVGCKLVSGPTGRRTCHVRATDARIVQSTHTMERMLYPPRRVYIPTQTYTPAYHPSSYTAPSYTPSYSSSSGGCGGDTPYAGGGQCWAIPYSIVQCESGGQNVPNSQGSGAQGYYQLMVGGYGSRAQQDAAAHALWADGAGAHNWTCAG